MSQTVSIKAASSSSLLLMFAWALLSICCGQAKQPAAEPGGSATTPTGQIALQPGVTTDQRSNKKPICCVAPPSRFKKNVLNTESSAIKRDSDNH